MNNCDRCWFEQQEQCSVCDQPGDCHLDWHWLETVALAVAGVAAFSVIVLVVICSIIAAYIAMIS